MIFVLFNVRSCNMHNFAITKELLQNGFSRAKYIGYHTRSFSEKYGK